MTCCKHRSSVLTPEVLVFPAGTDTGVARCKKIWRPTGCNVRCLEPVWCCQGIPLSFPGGALIAGSFHVERWICKLPLLDRRCLNQVGQKTGSLPTSGGPCDVKIFFKILQLALPVKDLELPGMALLASDGHQVAAFWSYSVGHHSQLVFQVRIPKVR